MSRKLLFVDRDGCLIEEPADEQIDSYEKLALLPGVIAALQRCVAAGYELVMVTNQDGLGTDSFPEAHFTGPHELLMRILASQGVRFREVLIDRSFPRDGLDTRKPGIGMLRADSPVASRIDETLLAGVKVIACENTMKGQKLERKDMLNGIAYVPAGVVELVEKQQQGWAYIRP